jgi:hypothetical protein
MDRLKYFYLRKFFSFVDDDNYAIILLYIYIYFF